MDNHQIQNRLKELYEKWQNKTISQEELFEFQEWLKMKEVETVFVPSEYAWQEDEVKGRILKNIEDRQAAVVHMARRRVFRRMAAASIIVVTILGAVGYFLLQSPGKNVASTVTVADAQPGQDRAILQLSDGSRIVLDEIANGQIREEENARVTKLDGELSYSGNSLKESGPEVFNTMLTPRGGQYKLKLSDGTLVWLNSASSIRYPANFTGKERVVELTGEAYFEVARNPSKPFKVKTDKLNITVLGTHFNINAYRDEPEIQATLLEGRIKVDLKTGTALKMSPGQQAIIPRAKDNISLVRDPDITKAVSWQRGIFEFSDADLGLIARQLSRWYDIDVVTEGNLGVVRLGGGISKKSPLSLILKVMEKNRVKHKWRDGKLVLYSE